MPDAVVALGGNLGDVAAAFRAALELLAGPDPRGVARTQVRAVSRLYRTPALLRPGAAPQPDYLNAACLVATTLGPAELLARLHDIEFELGRTRGVRWAARTLDLDLIAYEGARIAGPALHVPHKEAQKRSFVLQPLIDLGVDWPLDANGRGAAECLADGQAAPIAIRAESLSWRLL